MDTDKSKAHKLSDFATKQRGDAVINNIVGGKPGSSVLEQGAYRYGKVPMIVRTAGGRYYLHGTEAGLPNSECHHQ